MYQTNQYEGMLAETVTVQGHKGDIINAYYARPLGPGPYPGMVIIHHAPGWDEWYRECTRRFAHHGYLTISPNLYFRDGHGTSEDVGAIRKIVSRSFARKTSANFSPAACEVSLRAPLEPLFLGADFIQTSFACRGFFRHCRRWVQSVRS